MCLEDMELALHVLRVSTGCPGSRKSKNQCDLILQTNTALLSERVKKTCDGAEDQTRGLETRCHLILQTNTALLSEQEKKTCDGAEDQTRGLETIIRCQFVRGIHPCYHK
ncbi:hypothetical protein JZ751_029386 [Albula glossodonta]|uniref:Uncharacterized protein n=1 Tax=Albula glossodonta TaxID=121402 RepID=A0A8T2PHX5_9TELE|nr:hypothetical protein JZ751_029386 [Albula glossodonta]